ncbi:hypothetical protein HK097_011046 [Rhizophlyctis rosea]|uniref:PACRG-like protein n=1 Tax=Rhizophlyctis rosea TaxID=64517 RepID=A0AAD5SER6_9FUNG|nr:hypothetical protein HK097_011046 [Rhizophlyctis rosea]
MLSKAPTGRAPPPPPSSSPKRVPNYTSSTRPTPTRKSIAAAAEKPAVPPSKRGPAKAGAETQSKPSVNADATKLSMRFHPAVVDPLGKGGHKTTFSAVYSKGGIPCRLNHGSVKHKLSWTRPPESLDYNPLLPTMIDGLRETQHPYTFVVRQGLKEMLEAPGAAPKALAVLPALVAPLRAALGIKEKESFLISLSIFVKLAELLGTALVPYLGTLIPPIATRVLSSQSREEVYEALRVCEMAGGEEAQKIIRTKVPTYSSVFL